jgi:hypothetical protein
MSECILSCSAVNLADTLAKLPPASWMFLERIPTNWLEPAERDNGIQLTKFDANTDWTQWQRGRVFCKDWELRWEGSHAVYTGPEVQLPGFRKEPVDLAAAERREQEDPKYLLWGRRDGGRFIELQVARVLKYPVAFDRVHLVVAEWLDPYTGEPIASRCVCLQEATP